VKLKWLSDVERRPRRVAVGTFDGMHLGHREVIRGSDTVLTFEPHPLAVTRPEALPKLLDTLAIKSDLVAELGVEETVVIPFDKDFAGQRAEQFVADVLVGALDAKRVAVGENFRFGWRAEGDPALLEAHDEFETRVVSIVETEGETVSSSRIRALIAAGDVARAAVYLGRPFMMEGPVTRGDARGRELGMPTANLVPDDHYACPGHGVYAAWASVAGNYHPAAVSVGVRPTFGRGRSLLVEAHLIDFSGDLYGETLRIAYLERLRGERRFDAVDDLVEQMHADVARAREIAGSGGGAGLPSL